MKRFKIILSFVVVFLIGTSQQLMAQAESCEETTTLSVIADYLGAPQGYGTYDQLNGIFYTRSTIGTDPEIGGVNMLHIVDISQGGTYNSIEAPILSEFEYDPNSGLLFGLHYDGSNNYFASFDPSTQILTTINVLNGLCGQIQGLSSFDSARGIYIVKAVMADDCQSFLNERTVILTIDVSTGQIINEFTSSLINFEYDQNSNKLIGITQENSTIYFSSLNIDDGVHVNIAPIIDLYGMAQGVSGLDNINGKYVFSGNRIIDDSNPEDPITESLLYIVDINTGEVVNTNPQYVTEFEYDENLNVFVGVNGSGEIQTIDISGCEAPINYELPEINITCSDASFNAPIGTSSDPVSNIIGYDITVVYDPAVLTPTGNIIIPADLIDPSYVSALMSDNNGEVYISLALNGSAPAGTTWSGTGQLFEIEFENLGTIGNGATQLEIIRMEESYLMGTEPQQVSGGTVNIQQDVTYDGQLVEALSGDAIGNDVNTVISGTDANCNDLGVFNLSPAADGSFSVDVTQATSISIVRDIANSTDMMPVIGGDDALTVQKVLINHSDITATPPSITQMMAMDVNMDGKVTAGDLSQINMRTVGTLGEFMQSWNYDNSGTSNGTPSLDWGFVEENKLTEPAYQISSSFPNNDGTGYSKSKVPVFGQCHDLPISGDASCPDISDSQFLGVLLGDIDSNVSSKLGEGNYRSESEDISVLIDLSEAEITKKGKVAIPIEVMGVDITNLDLNISFDADVLVYSGMGKRSSGTIKYLDRLKSPNNILLTSYSLKSYVEGKPTFYLEFETRADKIAAGSFGISTGYSNGESVTVDIKGEAIKKKLKGQLDGSLSENLEIFPNPVSDQLSLSFQHDETGIVKVRVYDMFGKQKWHKNFMKDEESFYKLIDIDRLSVGMYILEIRFDDESIRSRVIKN